MKRLLGAIFAAAAAICVVACNLNFKYADAVQGTVVQQKIDETVAPLLTSYYPKLKIGPSQCESIIQITQGTMGTCTLPVNGVPLQIRVASAGPPDMFKVDFGGAFFFHMPTVEKMIETTLVQNYRINAVAECGDPRERLLQPGTYFTCAVKGSPQVHSVRLKAAANGQVFEFNVPGLKVASLLPDADLTLHKEGKVVVVSGTAVEAYIQQIAAFAPNSNGKPVAVTCPSRMDLTGNKRGVCTVKILNQSTPQRIAVWISEAMGFAVRPIDAVIDRTRVQSAAQDDLNRRLADNGDAADAVVVCKPGVVVIQPPKTFYCKATAAGKRYRLEVRVEDYKGYTTWRAIPLGGGSN
jgi:hypothetical protein